MIRARPRPGTPSFTLVEVLTATAVLSILFSIMFGILQQTSKGWQAANRRVEASQVARLALDQIASDLENCVAITAQNLPVPGREGATTNYGFGFVHAEKPSATSDTLAQSSLPTGSVNLSEPNDYIFVVTPYAPSMAMGTVDLCEVGYVPAYVVKTDGYAGVKTRRYVLLRHMPLIFSGDTTTTVTTGYARPTNDFLINPEWFLTPPLRDNQDPRNFFPIVDNLVAFNVEFRHTNPSVVYSNWGRPGPNGSWTNRPDGAPNGLPLAADITLSIIDEKAAERLKRIRGTSAPLTDADKRELSQIPVDWSKVSPDVRSTLQESVLTLKRRVFFKNAQP